MGNSMNLAANSTSNATNRIAQAGRTIGQSMNNAANSTNQASQKVTKAGQDMGNSMDAAGNKTKLSAHQIADAAGIMGVAFTVAGGLIAAGLTKATATFADFEQEITNAGVISNATAKEMQLLEQTAIKLGASTSKSASEVAAAMTDMARAGFEVNEIVAAMPGIISAAEAANADLAQTAEVVAAALNGFQLKAHEASRVADIMAMAANKSAADIEDLGYAFKYAAPSAKSLGISVEELAAAVGILSDAGIRGMTAGTSLRSIINDLVDPTKKAEQEMKKLGVSVFDQKGKFVGLSEAVDRFSKATKNMSDEQKLAALSTIFETDSLNAMLVLMNKGKGNIDSFTNSLKNSSGASEEAANKMKDTLKGSLEQLSGAFESVGIVIGESLSPAIRAFAKVIETLLDGFLSLPKPVQQFLSITAALGSALLIIVGVITLVVAGVAAFAAAFGVTIAVAAKVIAGILLLVSGIGLLIAAFAAVVIGIITAYNKFEWFRNMVNQVWASIKAGVASLANFLKPIVQEVVTFINQQWQKIKDWWDKEGPGILEAARIIWEAIKSYLKLVWDQLKTYWDAVFPYMKTVAKNNWEMIKEIISAALDIILAIIKVWAAMIRGDWDEAWETYKNIMNRAKDALVKIGQKLMDNLDAIIEGGLKALKTLWDMGWSVIQKIAEKVWQAIKNKIKSELEQAKQQVDNKMDQIKNAIKTKIDAAKKAVENAANSIKNKLSSLANSAYNWGSNLGSMFAKGIGATIDKAVAKAKSAAAKIKSYLGWSSPTEKGPGKDSDKWAPNLVNMLATGIEAGIPRIAIAASRLAGAIAVLGQPSNLGTVTPSYVTTTPQYQPQDAPININIDQMIVRNDNDIREIAKELDRLRNQELRARGRVVFSV